MNLGIYGEYFSLIDKASPKEITEFKKGNEKVQGSASQGGLMDLIRRKENQEKLVEHERGFKKKETVKPK